MHCIRRLSHLRLYPSCRVEVSSRSFREQFRLGLCVLVLWASHHHKKVHHCECYPTLIASSLSPETWEQFCGAIARYEKVPGTNTCTTNKARQSQQDRLRLVPVMGSLCTTAVIPMTQIDCSLAVNRVPVFLLACLRPWTRHPRHSRRFCVLGACGM